MNECVAQVLKIKLQKVYISKQEYKYNGNTMERVMAVLCFLITIAINSKSLVAVPQEVNANFTFQNKLELHASGNILEIMFLQFEDCDIWHDSGKGRENLLAILNGSVRLVRKTKTTCFSIPNFEDRAVLTIRCPSTRILSGKIMIGDCSNQTLIASYSHLKEFRIEDVLEINYSDNSNLTIRINTSFTECDVHWNSSQGEKNLSLLILGGRLKNQRKLLPKDVDVDTMEGWIFVSIKKTFLDFVKFQIKCSSHHQQPQPFSVDFELSLKDSVTAKPTTVSTNDVFSTKHLVSSDFVTAAQTKVTNTSSLDSTKDPVSFGNSDKGTNTPSVHTDNTITVVVLVLGGFAIAVGIGHKVWHRIKHNNASCHPRNIHLINEANQPLINGTCVLRADEQETRSYICSNRAGQSELKKLTEVNKCVLQTTYDNKLYTTDSISAASYRMLETSELQLSETQESEIQEPEMGSKIPVRESRLGPVVEIQDSNNLTMTRISEQILQKENEHKCEEMLEMRHHKTEQPADSNDDKPIHSLISLPENDCIHSRMVPDKLETEQDDKLETEQDMHVNAPSIRKNYESPMSGEFTNNSDVTESGMGFFVRNTPQILKEKVENQTRVEENLEDNSKTKIAAEDSSELPPNDLNLDLRNKTEEINTQKNVLLLEKINKASPLESVLKDNKNNSTLTTHLPPMGQECSNLYGLSEKVNENKTEILVEGNTNKVREEPPLSELKCGLANGTEWNGRSPSNEMSQLMQTGQEQYDNIAREDRQITTPEFFDGNTTTAESKDRIFSKLESGPKHKRDRKSKENQEIEHKIKFPTEVLMKNKMVILRSEQTTGVNEQNKNDGEASKRTQREQNENGEKISKITEEEHFENNAETSRITKGEQIENNREIPKIIQGKQNENEGETSKITKGEQIENREIPKITQGEQNENEGETSKIIKGEQIENNREIPKITQGEQNENERETLKITQAKQNENEEENSEIT